VAIEAGVMLRINMEYIQRFPASSYAGRSNLVSFELAEADTRSGSCISVGSVEGIPNSSPIIEGTKLELAIKTKSVLRIYAPHFPAFSSSRTSESCSGSAGRCNGGLSGSGSSKNYRD
jgi:hypothetical protein